jgi:predicted CoA-binding protein
MNHDPDDLRRILTEARTIALVGASQNPMRPSHEVMTFLLSKNYHVIPVNPALNGQKLLGQNVVGALADIQQPIDIVDIFRNAQEAGGIVDEALALPILPKVIWMQIGVINEAAAHRARDKAVAVVMNHCPKIEYSRLMPQR